MSTARPILMSAPMVRAWVWVITFETIHRNVDDVLKEAA